MLAAWAYALLFTFLINIPFDNVLGFPNLSEQTFQLCSLQSKRKDGLIRWNGKISNFRGAGRNHQKWMLPIQPAVSEEKTMSEKGLTIGKKQLAAYAADRRLGVICMFMSYSN